MTDTYTIYSQWFAQFYGRPFTTTREEFALWCRAPRINRCESDVEFDYAKERDGDGQ